MTNLRCHQIEEIKAKFSKGIYFLCPSSSDPERAYYSHSLVCLAEGLKELGIPVYSNVDYWQVSTNKKDFLLKKEDNIQKEDCSVVVLDNNWFRSSGEEILKDLLKKNRKYIAVYIDGSDGIRSNAWKPDFRRFDLILKMHMLNGFCYPENFFPWVFGLSKRQILYLKEPVDSLYRKPHLNVSFRNTTVQHSVRKYVYRSFLSKIEKVLEVDIWESSSNEHTAVSQLSNDMLHWIQTGKRHDPNYFEKLSQSLACACFGGFFILGSPNNHSSKVSSLSKYFFSKSNWRSKTIIQWDSFRFWESLAAGCVSFQADFDKYYFTLPEKPENLKHYVGIDFDNQHDAIEKILDNPDMLHSISKGGREWVMKHYAPVPVAVRFLEVISKKLN
jgi:hypothetical protein